MLVRNPLFHAQPVNQQFLDAQPFERSRLDGNSLDDQPSNRKRADG